MCFSYIHDCILYPLPLTNPIRQNINLKSLQRCIHPVTRCIQRAVSDISVNLSSISSFMTTQNLIIYIESAHPEMIKELIHATDICIDTSVACKTKDPNTIIRVFLGTKLHEILKQIYHIHRQHTTKPNYVNPSSLGPLPFWKLCEIRSKIHAPVKNEPSENDELYC
jgi:hypothetical protein